VHNHHNHRIKIVPF